MELEKIEQYVSKDSLIKLGLKATVQHGIWVFLFKFSLDLVNCFFVSIFFKLFHISQQIN